jgi:hypothetical protein
MKKIIWQLSFLSIFFFILLIFWGNFLIQNNFIRRNSFKENFDFYPNYNNWKNYDIQQKFSRTVDLPINTNYDCQNMCTSQSKCYITKGLNCTSDADCPGCLPVYKEPKYKNKNIKGQDGAGKYGFYQPQFSILTKDIGTQAKIYSTPFSKTNLGFDFWKGSSDFSVSEKPVASNAYLSSP